MEENFLSALSCQVSLGGRLESEIWIGDHTVANADEDEGEMRGGVSDRVGMSSSKFAQSSSDEVSSSCIVSLLFEEVDVEATMFGVDTLWWCCCAKIPIFGEASVLSVTVCAANNELLGGMLCKDVEAKWTESRGLRGETGIGFRIVCAG